ncbi:MAG: T9SS type A sorting domain-containing protein [Chlorobi bacterium]|nr:T9SS type A sorting domain-containing protein [Chlorobiota bacterium]
MQATYEEFGCNEGDVFVIGIDKGNSTQNVIYFDSVYGVTYPNVSGNDGGGNPVHLAYDIQGTPTVVIIAPTHEILVKQILPPDYESLVDSLLEVGANQQPCFTAVGETKKEDILRIGPNPVNKIAILNLSFSTGKSVEVKIYNLTGQQILGIGASYYSPGIHRIKADLTAEPEGFYFVQIIEDNQVLTTRKLIKY